MRLPAAILALLLALGCTDEPPVGPPDGGEGISFEVAPPPVGEQSELFAEGVPLAETVSPVPETPPPTPPARKEHRRSARGTPAASAPLEQPAPETRVPLESLLRTPGVASAPPDPMDLGAPATEPDGGGAAAAPGALERWKERVRVTRSQEAIGRPGPRQGSVSHTEAGLRVPVDDAVVLEGGVRVDSRDEPGIERDERSSIPRVGVEVKF